MPSYLCTHYNGKRNGFRNARQLFGLFWICILQCFYSGSNFFRAMKEQNTSREMMDAAFVAPLKEPGRQNLSQNAISDPVKTSDGIDSHPHQSIHPASNEPLLSATQNHLQMNNSIDLVQVIDMSIVRIMNGTQARSDSLESSSGDSQTKPNETLTDQREELRQEKSYAFNSSGTDTSEVVASREGSQLTGSSTTLDPLEREWVSNETTEVTAARGSESNATVAALDQPNATVAALDEQQHRHHQERLNTTQILKLLETNTFDRWQVPLAFPKPPLDSYDISSIYSQKAWLKLRDKMLTKGEELVMSVNGASSTAGCCGVELNERYHKLFARSALRNVTIADRAHGSRNSMHSALLMHSFLPLKTDIILWEFAITDSTYNQFENETMKMTEARNQLILWLDQVERVAKQRNESPPLVILVYLWNTFQFNDFKRFPNLAFEAGKGVAEQYDFVVGHVNAGKYFASLWEPNVTQTYFLGDPIHPNTLGHHVIHFLLLDLLMEEQRKERPRLNQTSTRMPYEWVCGDESAEKRLLRGLLENRRVLASFTQEQPKNEDLLPGMLLPQVGGDLKIENLGKSNALRSDRKYSAILPCCGDSIMSFDDVAAHGILEGIQLGLHPNSTGLTLFFDTVDVTDKVITCRNQTEWQCILSDSVGSFLHWVVLEAPRNVSRISMCNHLRTCNSTMSNHLSVESMTVYGVE